MGLLPALCTMGLLLVCNGAAPCLVHHGIAPCIMHLGAACRVHCSAAPCVVHHGIAPCIVHHLGAAPCKVHRGIAPCVVCLRAAPCIVHHGIAPCLVHLKGAAPCLPWGCPLQHACGGRLHQFRGHKAAAEEQFPTILNEHKVAQCDVPALPPIPPPSRAVVGPWQCRKGAVLLAARLLKAVFIPLVHRQMKS